MNNPRNFPRLRRDKRRTKPRIPLEAQLAQMREVWRVNHPYASEQETRAAFAEIARLLGI